MVARRCAGVFISCSLHVGAIYSRNSAANGSRLGGLDRGVRAGGCVPLSHSEHAQDSQALRSFSASV